MADKLVVGCGYLGRAVAARWQTAGHRVFCTTRGASRADELGGLGLEPVVCDVLRPESLSALPPSAEALVYCVGFDPTSGVPMRTVYVDGLENVLRALSDWRGRFLHISSTSVYGQTDGEYVNEGADTQPGEESGRVVLAAEQVLRALRPDAIVLRFAGIYGPGRVLRAKQIMAGEAIAADPDGWLNLIHVEDGATAVLAAEARARLGSVYNVADDHPLRRRDFYGHFATMLGVPAPRFQTLPITAIGRRIANGAMKSDLGVELRYPSALSFSVPRLSGSDQDATVP